MTTFTKGVRENVGLWINLIGGTGSGKTFTAMRLASGICAASGLKAVNDPKDIVPFALIDTENRRGLHYADQFNFDHAELRAPFRPDAYADAVMAADAAGYPVIVVDSGSHVWAGDGGMLDWQEEELDRMAGTDWQKRERVKMSTWIKPKMAHKHMVSKFLQVRAHIVLCLRAEQKIEMVKKGDKTIIQPKQSLTGLDGWIPVADKNLPFEATCSFLFTADAPGIPKPIKLQNQHKELFPLTEQVTEQSGKRLAEWAAGKTKQPAAQTNGNLTDIPATNPAEQSAPADPTTTITPDEALALEARCTENNIKTANVKKFFKVERFSQLTPAQLAVANENIRITLAEREAAK